VNSLKSRFSNTPAEFFGVAARPYQEQPQFLVTARLAQPPPGVDNDVEPFTVKIDPPVPDDEKGVLINSKLSARRGALSFTPRLNV
jgi:hypothetical protein